MLRPSVLAIVAAMLVAAPTFAADLDDWGNGDFEPLGGNSGLREGYATEPRDWSGLGDETDPVSFEAGVRYWYTMGGQSFGINSGLVGDHGQMSEADQTQFVEAHLRIDDESTNTFATALAGYGFGINGISGDDYQTVDVTGGSMGYAGGDINWAAIGDTKTGLGPLLGYMYWKNSPQTFSDNFTTATSADDITFDPSNGQTTIPGDSKVNDVAAQMLRLGISGNATFGDFDLRGDAAAVPYARVSGTLGAGSGFATAHYVQYDNQSGYGPVGPTGAINVDNIQSSPTTIDGWGYGAMAQASIGYHPTKNAVFRFGGRAWYLQGVADARFSRATIGDPTDANQPVPPQGPDDAGDLNPPNFDTPPTFGNQAFVTRDNPFTMFRYGVFAELSYAF